MSKNELVSRVLKELKRVLNEYFKELKKSKKE
jgi:hypothetical protein